MAGRAHTVRRGALTWRAAGAGQPATGGSRGTATLPAAVRGPAGALLATKLHVPTPSATLVERPRLSARLAEGLRRPLTLLAAPAGWGKTTLLSAWYAGVNAVDTAGGASAAGVVALAWVSLDEGDNDPTRFWMYVVAALQAAHPGVGGDALALLSAPHPPPIETILTALLNALAGERRTTVLVLDDYHVIQAPPIHQALGFVLDHLPPGLRLALATRADPPLPLARLRARGALGEIRADDLRFTPDEAASFLQQVIGVPVAAETVAALEARTEGWIAGLQLAALAMRDRADLAGFVAAFAGSNRFVLDYLTEEVLSRQSEAVQAFLLRTSILDRMCAGLCDALGAAGDAPPGATAPSGPTGQAMLEHLERANLFVVALDQDRRWYRYHQLFAGALRVRLDQSNADLRLELHARAGAWFERAGLAAEAVEHALAAGDWERAVRVVEQSGLSTMLPAQVHTLVRWLQALPAALLGARPALAVVHAGALHFSNQMAAAEDRLRDAERLAQAGAPAAEAQVILGRAAAVRGNIARLRGDVARCVVESRRALALLPETEFMRAVAALNAANAYLDDGDVTPAAEAQAADAVSRARATGNPATTLRSLATLARLQTLQGRLRRAAATYAEAAAAATAAGGLQVLAGVPAYHVGLGDLLREQNDLDAAEYHLAEGLALMTATDTADAEAVALGYVALARLRHAQRAHGAALALLDEFVALAARRAFVAPLADRAAAVRAQLALLQGNPAAAERWVVASGLDLSAPPAYHREAEHLALVRIVIARAERQRIDDRLDGARRLLDRLAAEAEAVGRRSTVIESLALAARAAQAQGDAAAARVAIDRALTLGEGEGYVRVFLDEGPPLIALLRQAAGRGTAPEYVSRLLAAAAPAGSAPPDSGFRPSARAASPALIEPLTAREREVLALVAAGASNGEVADRLVVTLGTVKKYVSVIMGKLGARSRTEAAAKARTLGLL